MPLLRIHSCTNLNVWDKTPDEIAAAWFDNFKDPHPSLYETSSAREEVEAVAAFSLTNPAKRDVYHLMRIDRGDLVVAGLKPNDDTPGNTGVIDVDFRHWEIVGEKAKLVRLVSCVRERVVAGEERLRWIGVLAQEECWKRFLSRPAALVIKEAQRRCRAKLEKQKTQPAFRAGQILAELAADPPAIPEERIRRRAWLNYEHRRSRQEGGETEADWFAAEKELSQKYAQGIAGYSPPGELPKNG